MTVMDHDRCPAKSRIFHPVIKYNCQVMPSEIRYIIKKLSVLLIIDYLMEYSILYLGEILKEIHIQLPVMNMHLIYFHNLFRDLL